MTLPKGSQLLNERESEFANHRYASHGLEHWNQCLADHDDSTTAGRKRPDLGIIAKQLEIFSVDPRLHVHAC